MTQTDIIFENVRFSFENGNGHVIKCQNTYLGCQMLSIVKTSQLYNYRVRVSNKPEVGTSNDL